MRLGGFEPPTHGLEGRCSSAELQARYGSVALPWVELWAAAESRHGRGAAGVSAGAGAEVGGDDRRRAAAVDAGSASRVDGAEADLTPAAVEQVRPVGRAREPELERARGADVGSAPDEVLAHGPPAEAPRRVCLLEPLRERLAVRRIVAEEAALRHLRRVA